MSDKTRPAISVPTTYWSQQTDNKKWNNWIEDAISKKHIKYYDYKFFSNLKKIGSGSFGNVYCANWKTFHTTLALKALDPSTNASRSTDVEEFAYEHKTLEPSNNARRSIDVEEFAYELKIQREVHFYDHIIKFYGITKVDSSKKYMLVMEYADSGTLNEYLKKNFKNLTWDDKLKMAHQLACAVLFLHNEGIIHRDLHSKNVLVHQKSIKLADFGLSKRVDDLVKSNSATGMVPYVDPRKFTLGKKYSLSKKSDIYSIGVLLWVISSGRSPYEGKNDYYLMVNIPKGLREVPIPNTPKDYEKIYTDCWKDDPKYRPDIKEIVARLETIISKNNSTKGSQSYNFNTDVQKPLKHSTNDFQSYDFNSALKHSTNDFQSYDFDTALKHSTSDFQSYDFNSDVQKPLKHNTNDFQSYDFNSDVQKPLKHSTNDFQSYDFNSDVRKPLKHSTNDFQSYDFNSDVQKPLRPLSSFAKDFYSFSSDDDVEQIIKMINNNP